MSRQVLLGLVLSCLASAALVVAAALWGPGAVAAFLLVAGAGTGVTACLAMMADGGAR